MTKGTWIYVPERDDGGEPWTGRIWSEGEQSQRWNFETIRHANLKKIYGCGVFEGAKPVSVLLDHQRPATLIRPLVLQVDPGKVGALLIGVEKGPPQGGDRRRIGTPPLTCDTWLVRVAPAEAGDAESGQGSANTSRVFC